MDAEKPPREALRVRCFSCSSDCPPRLAEVLQYAIFPGGARVRRSLSSPWRRPAARPTWPPPRGACAIEMLHCASLVLTTCPVDSTARPNRRGKPSVHVAYGERLAVLAGDALIVKPFNVVAAYPDMIRIVAQSVGAPNGICAGQAWECEDKRDLVRYQRAKTGALFAACTIAGCCGVGT